MSQTTINKIIDEFDLGGDQQTFIAGELFGEAVLWEFLDRDQQKKLVDIYNDDRMEGWVEEYEQAVHGKLVSDKNEDRHLETVTEDSSAKLTSQAAVSVGTSMTDDDTGEVIEVTPEMRDEALQIHGQIEGAFWQLASALSRIKNEKLYLALGFNSFKGYCKETLPFGVRSAYHYALVGEKIGSRLLEAGEGAKSTSQSLESAGIEKLRLIASKAEDQINELVEKGKITIGDEELSAEELKDRRVKDLKEMLKNANQKAQKAELLEEQKKNVEIEKEAIEEERDELAEKWENAKERAENQEDIEKYLKEIETKRERVVELMTRLTPEIMFQYANDEQTERLARLLTMWQQSAVRQKKMHLELIEKIDAESFELEEEEIMNTIS